MKLFASLNHKPNVTELVQQGLANSTAVTTRQIRNCIFLLGDALGETWSAASREVAAGMALVALAKDSRLTQYLNRNGWRLVIKFVSANPEIASKLSPRTTDEIITYQQSHWLMRQVPA